MLAVPVSSNVCDFFLHARLHTRMSNISFPCPSCSGSLTAPSEMANQLMECPSCKQTIEVPIRSRRLTPDFTKIGANASKDESVFFQDGDIMVTNARFVVGARTFAIRGITSVGLALKTR